jgi:hypothetical protein
MRAGGCVSDYDVVRFSKALPPSSSSSSPYAMYVCASARPFTTKHYLTEI